MDYTNYTLEELKEEVKDAARVYEQDKENALQAQKEVVKSELNYFKAKIALLEFKK